MMIGGLPRRAINLSTQIKQEFVSRERITSMSTALVVEQVNKKPPSFFRTSEDGDRKGREMCRDESSRQLCYRKEFVTFNQEIRHDRSGGFRFAFSARYSLIFKTSTTSANLTQRNSN